MIIITSGKAGAHPARPSSVQVIQQTKSASQWFSFKKTPSVSTGTNDAASGKSTVWETITFQRVRRSTSKATTAMGETQELTSRAEGSTDPVASDHEVSLRLPAGRALLSSCGAKAVHLVHHCWMPSIISSSQ
jgi:hypothetical protein